jgi:hypothetical protein
MRLLQQEQQVSQRAPPGAHLCFVCGFLHPLEWQCPEMSSVVKLRLALDRLKSDVTQPATQVAVKRQFLLARLRELTLLGQFS